MKNTDFSSHLSILIFVTVDHTAQKPGIPKDLVAREELSIKLMLGPHSAWNVRGPVPVGIEGTGIESNNDTALAESK